MYNFLQKAFTFNDDFSDPDDEEGVEEEEFEDDDDEGSDEPGLKDGMIRNLLWYSKSFIAIHLVYNEDLEEDNSDWNEVGEDEEEDDIDSDGKLSLQASKLLNS